MNDASERETVRLSPEQKRRRRMRSLAIALALGGLAVLFFIVTLVRMGSNPVTTGG